MVRVVLCLAVACAMAVCCVYVYLIEGVHVAFEDILVLLALHDRELFTTHQSGEGSVVVVRRVEGGGGGGVEGGCACLLLLSWR